MNAVKRFSRLFLHIGPHKTGSSAIQALCDENRALLARRHGILYPSGRWHAQLGSCVSENKLSYIYNVHAGHTDLGAISASDDAYLAELEAQFAVTKCTRAVLSYEGFVDLQPAAVVNLRDFIFKHSDDIKVIAYCRHPLSFVPSEISQRIRMGLPSLGEDGCEFLIPKFIAYFQKYEAAFGHDNIRLTEFAREALYNGDVRLDFLAKLGLAEGEIGEFPLDAEHGNESLSAEAAYIAEAMAKLVQPALKKQNMFYLRFGRLLASLDGRPIDLSPAEAEAVMAAARADLDYLRQTFGLELTPPPPRPARGHGYVFSEEALNALAKYLLDNDDLAQAYRWLLGRAPTSSDGIYDHLMVADGDWRNLRSNIVRSEEFRQAVACVREATPAVSPCVAVEPATDDAPPIGGREARLNERR